MSALEKLTTVINELESALPCIKDEQLDRLIDCLLHTEHIFTAGAGRSGLAMKAFAMRLMHLGFNVNNVGETCSTHTQLGDLLIVSSGSGETDSLVSLARKAKKNNLTLALITTAPTSTIGQLADVIVTMPGVSPKLNGIHNGFHSIQPMGATFEQLCFLMYDAIVLETDVQDG